MIRKTWNKDKWLLTCQTEHARLSAIMAASWKFPGEKPGDEVIKAIMGHDDGWKETDIAPPVKPNGDPRDFMEMKAADSAAIFEKSIQLRRDAGHVYGAALVAGHFLSLAETADLSRASTVDAIELGRFIARTRRALGELKTAVAEKEDGARLLENYETDLRFLRVCDYLSLLLCSDFAGEEVITDVPYLEEGDTLRVVRTNSKLALSLSPLPFKKNLRDHLTSWSVPVIPYDSSEELALALEEVKTTTNEVHLGAASS
jgi:hypothetical protein